MIGVADASFDVLAIVSRLGAMRDGVLEGEVHMIAYLAYLLSLYAGDGADDWGYGFVTTESAAPFSEEVDQAIMALSGVGLITPAGPILRGGKLSSDELQRWASFPRNAARLPIVTAAAEATAQLALPTMVRGLSQEPQLRHAAEAGGLRALPDPAGLLDLKEHFATVDRVFDGGLVDRGSPDLDEELIVRAVLWLDYLQASNAAVAPGDGSYEDD